MQSTLGRTSLDQQHIAVLNHIVLALGHDLPGRLDRRFVAVFFQHVVVVHHSLNEGFLEVYIVSIGLDRRIEIAYPCEWYQPQPAP